MKKLDWIVDRRRELAARYRQRLSRATRWLSPPYVPTTPSRIFRATPSQAHRRRVRSRLDLMQRLLDAGIATRRGIMLAHREPAYAGRDWRSCRAPSGPATARCSCRSIRK